jgi:hypothetical protein
MAAIQNHLQDQPDCVGGNFRLHFDGDSDFARWLTKFYAWIRKRGFYYGDSGISILPAVWRNQAKPAALNILSLLRLPANLRAGVTGPLSGAG